MRLTKEMIKKETDRPRWNSSLSACSFHGRTRSGSQCAQREQEQEFEQPEGLQTEEADLGKSTCKLQGGNIEQPKHGPEYQYQNQLNERCASWAHISHRSGCRKEPDGTGLSEKS